MLEILGHEDEGTYIDRVASLGPSPSQLGVGLGLGLGLSQSLGLKGLQVCNMVLQYVSSL